MRWRVTFRWWGLIRAGRMSWRKARPCDYRRVTPALVADATGAAFPHEFRNPHLRDVMLVEAIDSDGVQVLPKAKANAQAKGTSSTKGTTSATTPKANGKSMVKNQGANLT